MTLSHEKGADEAVRRYIQSLGAGAVPGAGPLNDAVISVLGHGFNNRLYALKTAHGAYVLKVYPRGRAERMRREYEALKTLDPIEAVPKAYAADAKAAFIDAPALICEKIEGTPMQKTGVTDADLDRLVEVWLQIHRIEPATAGLLRHPAGPQEPRDCLGYIEQMHEALARPARNRDAWFQNAVERLDEFIRCLRLADLRPGLWRRRVRLCQVDCRLANVMKDADGNVRVVDWEHAGIMDPAYEVASFFRHPDAALITDDQRERAIRRYAEAMDDPFCGEKINVYLTLLPVQWLARLLVLIAAGAAPLTQPWVIPATEEELRRDAERYTVYARDALGASWLR